MYRSHYEILISAMYCVLKEMTVENDQPPEAANVLYWFEKVPYLLS